MKEMIKELAKEILGKRPFQVKPMATVKSFNIDSWCESILVCFENL